MFEINPYDQCVENEMIGGKKMIVCWYVDYLKVSHVDPKEVTTFMEWLEGVYRDMSITRVKVHKYLDMMLDFRTPGYLWVTMVYYLKGFMEDLP